MGTHQCEDFSELIHTAPAMLAPSSSAAETSPDAAPRTQAGYGRLHVAHVDGCSSALCITAQSPLKLLVPQPRGDAVWMFTSSFGGGLVSGDRLVLDVEVEAGAAAALGTQSSTKVYRGNDSNAEAEQVFHADVGAGAALALVPDPVTPYADSRYRQRIDIDLAADASLLLIDTLTSGRSARAEQWAFSLYDSRISIRRNHVPLLIDATRLDNSGRSLSDRMSPMHVLSTVVLLGPRFTAAINAINAWCQAQPVMRNASLLITASPLADGLLLRLAGTAYEPIERWLRTHLHEAVASFGDHWSRKP